METFERRIWSASKVEGFNDEFRCKTAQFPIANESEENSTNG